MDMNSLLNGILDDDGGDVSHINFAGSGNGVENCLGNFCLVGEAVNPWDDEIRYLIAQFIERGYALVDHVFC